ncbi:MAG: MerC domain-containing protein [Blastocatellia bacterium]|nr:MerC domain-containing protein [Blastocatellia bacterium]
MQTYNEKEILDYTGATVSWICAVHCLAMPFFITFLPVIGLSFLADEITEMDYHFEFDRDCSNHPHSFVSSA